MKTFSLIAALSISQVSGENTGTFHFKKIKPEKNEDKDLDFFVSYDSQKRQLLYLLTLSKTENYAIKVQIVYNGKKIGNELPIRKICFSGEPVLTAVEDEPTKKAINLLDKIDISKFSIVINQKVRK